MKPMRSLGFSLVTIVIPFFIIMSAVRILLIPYWFPDLEYHAAGFPADTYGFNVADRMKWSRVSFDYLLNDQPIAWLANFKLDANLPLYNERELSHMVDVKVLIQAMITAWWLLLGFLLVAGVLSWRGQEIAGFARAVSRGGWLTAILIVAILVFVVLSFDSLFTDFHRLFFSGDTWLFYYSDTLIRLFPMHFWQDAFIWMGSLSLSLGLVVGLLGRKATR
jgi:integral membrane protein (TIGR01906 family)